MPQPNTLSASILILTLASLATGILATPTDAQRRRSSWRDRAALKNLIYKSDQSFATKSIDRGVFSIYLPKEYDDKKNAAKRYPVIYFLHGLNEDNNRFHTRGGATVLDKVIGDKGAPPLIFVCVYDGSRRSFYIDSRRGKVETMIVKDLIKHVDTRYRTIATRDSRALLGVSMGGFGALKIAFKHTAMFGSVATHSAAILPVEYADLGEMFPWATQRGFAASIFGDPVDEKMWAANNPLSLAQKMDPAKLRQLAIYLDCGDHDRYGLDQTNVRMHELLTKRKIPHAWTLVKGGNHGWNTRGSAVGYNTANLPNSLRFIAKAWARGRGTKALQGLLGGRTKPTPKPKK